MPDGLADTGVGMAAVEVVVDVDAIRTPGIVHVVCQQFVYRRPLTERAKLLIVNGFQGRLVLPNPKRRLQLGNACRTYWATNAHLIVCGANPVDSLQRKPHPGSAHTLPPTRDIASCREGLRNPP